MGRGGFGWRDIMVLSFALEHLVLSHPCILLSRNYMLLIILSHSLQGNHSEYLLLIPRLPYNPWLKLNGGRSGLRDIELVGGSQSKLRNAFWLAFTRLKTF